MHRRLTVLALAGMTVFGGCLENEEEITVSEDGSVSIRVSAAGYPHDIADGYPVPLHAPFKAWGEETDNWVSRFGADTGSPSVQQAVGKTSWTGPDGKPKSIKIASHGEFDRLEDLPSWFAPTREPYRTAYLERTGTLRIEAKGGKKLYHFERRFHSRRFKGWDAMELIKEGIPEETMELLARGEELDAETEASLIELAQRSFHRTVSAHVRDAVAGLYLEGDATLPVETWQAVVDQITTDATVPAERLREVRRRSLERDLRVKRLQEKGLQLPPEDKVEYFGRLEQEVRGRLRESLQRTLASNGIPLEVIHAVQARLEWSFTDLGNTADLGGEKFKVTVHLPGVAVAGNYAENKGGTVRWVFSGDELRDRTVVLEAVSVLE